MHQSRKLIQLTRAAKHIDMWKPLEDIRPIPLGHAADDADHQLRPFSFAALTRLA